jgi:hypothetical protein
MQDMIPGRLVTAQARRIPEAAVWRAGGLAEAAAAELATSPSAAAAARAVRASLERAEIDDM